MYKTSHATSPLPAQVALPTKRPACHCLQARCGPPPKASNCPGRNTPSIKYTREQRKRDQYVSGDLIWTACR